MRGVLGEARDGVDERGRGVSEGERVGIHSGGWCRARVSGLGRTRRRDADEGRDWGGREVEGHEGSGG